MGMTVTKPYSHVLEPIRIGPVTVQNRLYIPPHGLSDLTASGPHGSRVPSEDTVYYFEERAAAGVGLIFHSQTTFPRYLLPSPFYAESIGSFAAVAAAVHRHGCKIMAQLHYHPPVVATWDPFGAMIPSLAPSQYQRFLSHDTAYAMSAADINQWIAAFGQCTQNLASAGYDGIELHVSHGTLLELFLSPYFNKRTDDYGGTLDGRMRVLTDALKVVRLNMGSDMAIGIRLICEEMLPGGLTQEDGAAVLTKLVESDLIDFADLDIAVEPQQAPLMVASQFMDPLHIVSFVAHVRNAVKGRVVVMAPPGRLTTLAQAEKLIAEGTVDMVGAVREFIAEPELIKNALEGREDRNRTCTACNFCVGRREMGRGSSWGCTINPATGREKRWGVRNLRPAPRQCKVAVVGAGPAGMEAARVAALRGHEVVLIEGSDSLGGQLKMWARLPGRDVLRTTIEWYQARLEELGVVVALGRVASADHVLALKPDAVIVATGSRYEAKGESGFLAIPIPGHDRNFVYTPEQILAEGAAPRGRVVILDEEQFHAGVGIAEVLATSGAKVEIVTRDFSSIGPALFGSLEFPFIYPRLQQLGVKMTTMHYVKEIGDHTVTVFDILTNDEEVREVDAVVLATMRRPINELSSYLVSQLDQVYTIGDALSPRLLFDATYEGQRFARWVGEPDVPTNSGAAIFFMPASDDYPKPAANLLQVS
jgi:2,4-dienoyl-CoA reductase-like NADH-dependent reductase (Old Yellow Enzyme family)/pyruvate/2-oxoglutarate dehydrogenase complex dihydrolipoamide dehydrogenase (E3) component